MSTRPKDPPADLVVTRFGSGSDEIVVFGFAIPDGSEPLTDAESAVVRAMLEAKSNAEIATERSCAVRTIANQVASVFRKLGVRSRSELVATAALLGGRVE